ncbi:MAG: hypothetical protein ACFE0I_22150 [Elainellaceae cyanobacterium]
MLEPFPVIEISSDAPEESEAMGTKEKFWFRDPERGLCLYKKARPNTGEDWSEKIAAELCQLIGLPHANYELAAFNGDRISSTAIEFAQAMLTANRDRLLTLRDSLQ